MVKEFNEGHRFPHIRPSERRIYRGRRSGKKDKEYENDDHRLAQRTKQIMYGENTPGYVNFMKALEKHPELFKGCVPVKPSVMQKCSKRSWDGQIRKWRRALHMYDFVDFEDDEQLSKFVREALIEQNKNPLFFAHTPSKTLPDGNEILLTPHVKPNPDVVLPSDIKGETVMRVRYTFDDLLSLSEAPLVSCSILLPENLQWLDKRVDLEDDVEDDESDYGTPQSYLWSSPFTPGYTPKGTPYKSNPSNPSTPHESLPVRLFVDPLTPIGSEHDESPNKSCRQDSAAASAKCLEGALYAESYHSAPMLVHDDAIIQSKPHYEASPLELNGSEVVFAAPLFNFEYSPAPGITHQFELELGLHQLCIGAM